MVFQTFEQMAAANAASHPGIPGFLCDQVVMCLFRNWKGPKETGLWEKGLCVISKEWRFACQLL